MEEVGYLFLDEGGVKLVVSDGTATVERSNMPMGTWIDVEWDASRSKNQAMDPSTDIRNNEDVCTCCDLVFHPTSGGGDSVKLLLKQPPFFDGTTSDMTCHSTFRTHKEFRSDAALLMGVTFTCQNYGYIAVRRIQVLLLEEKEEEDEFVRISLVITFAIPELMKGNERGRRSMLPLNNVSSRKKTVTKPLPPSAQLLLSILRSDWGFLEKQMTKLEQTEPEGSVARKQRTVFPWKLSLEELYLRLRGVTTSELDAETTSSSLLTSLPQDILTTKIAPFLRACSVDALRRSCKLFHHNLRSLVPGLKLRLYSHQIRSLEWMRRRETRELSEEDVLDAESKLFGAESVRGDMHRAITGGATTCLRLRTTGEALRIDQQTGMEIRRERGMAVSRQIARGGLLCDDPGLGKTITVLSLILQTSGLSTEPGSNTSKSGTALSHTDEDIFQAYWSEHVPYMYRRSGYMKLLNAIRRHSVGAGAFEYPVDPAKQCCPDYFDIIDKPISLSQIEESLCEDYSFKDFQTDVDGCFQNAITYNPPGHQIHKAAVNLSKAFADIVDHFKAKQVQTAKKSFSKTCAKPNSSVAALLEKRHHEELVRSLKPSSGTLLVVPSTLLNHWEEQLKLYIDWKYVTDKIPLIYHYDGNRQEEVIDLCQIQGTHFPCVFIDKAGTKPLPPAEFLAMFRVVITTTQRLTNEWKHGSFDDELKRENGSKKYTAALYEVGGSLNDEAPACSLLKVHWLRLIADEGHSMGRGSSNSAILFASWITAQRYWAMTGTPTPQTASSSGLTNLRGLMRFLQHDFFSPRLEGDKVWQGNIVRSWNNGNLSAFFRLQSLMSLLMVRHTKLDIKGLEPPRFSMTRLTLNSEEIASYNALVSAIMSNILITSMEGLTSGRQDSLLYRSQSRNAREGFTNVRLVCSGRNGLFPTISDKNIRELIDMMNALGFEGVRLTLVKNFLRRVVTEQLSGCNVCGLQLHTLLLIPCGHFVCVDCFDNKVASCAVCGETFDVDTFQRLQPGIELMWHSPEEIDKSKAEEAASTDETEKTESTDSPQPINVADRVALQPAPARTRSRRRGDGHACEYDVASTEGKCTLCLEEHHDCILINRPRCSTCYKTSSACPEYETKSFYLTSKLKELHLKHPASLLTSPKTAKRPLKAIVFSEFRSTLNLVGDRLIRQFGGGCVAEYWGKSRDDELLKFAKSSDCFCMLLGRTGSEGLDLSFVTHIFFLEKVWDKSLENQAISRAWRLGATGPGVEVETLIARDTMEEMMLGMESESTRLRDPSSSSRLSTSSSAAWKNDQSGSTKEYQRAKLLFLLQNLKLIRPSNDGQHVNVQHKKRSRAAATGDASIGSSDNETETPKKKPAKVRFQD